MRFAVFASGGGTNFQSLIDNIASGCIDAEIVLLVASNDSAYAIQRARDNNIPVVIAKRSDYTSPAERDRAIIKELKNAGAEYIFLCGYLGILSAELVSLYPNKIINIHPSLLPAYGGVGMHGLRVHEEVLRRGEAFTGATVHFVDEGTDTGLIIMQKSIAIPSDISPKELQQKVLAECEHTMLPEVAALVAKGRIKVIDNKVIIE